MLVMPRLFLIASTDGVRSPAEHPSATIRQFSLEDVEHVSTLLVTAYRGTSEEEPDDDQEVGRFLNNEWGRAMLEASSVAVERSSGRIVGATLVCRREDFAHLAHVVVLPEQQGQGIAGSLIRASSEVLHALGEQQISLAVSAKNFNALRTYARLGFGLFAPEAIVQTSGLLYTTRKCFTAVFDQIVAAAPDLKSPTSYGVGVKRAGSTVNEWPFVNSTPDHQFPGLILALVTGWRSGEAEIPITTSILDAAIALCTPGATASLFAHPDLTAWIALRSTLQPGDAPVVRLTTHP